MSKLDLSVTAIRDLAPGIKSFILRRMDGHELPPFAAGAHIDIDVTMPDGRIAERSYSIVNAPTDGDYYEIAVLRESGGSGGSAFMHDCVKVGRRLSASAPRNDFPLAGDAAEHLLIAGGIGITPILSMGRALLAGGRCFRLHYCARSPEMMAYRGEVAALFGDRAYFHFDGGDPKRGLDLAALLARPVPGRHVYVCGPKAMNEAVIELSRKAGWPAEQVHFEFFTAAAAMAGDAAVEVVLKRSGRRLMVPADQTILQALIAAGEDPLFDCQRGECGVCVCGVVEGEPLHRDYYLTDREKAAGKSMCICVSRARGSRLVLDL
jgi:vanillate O-demethylase ferredoxin subunit